MTEMTEKDTDPVEEIHKYREELAKRFNYDPMAIAKYLREQGEKSGRKFVSFEKGPKLEKDSA